MQPLNTAPKIFLHVFASDGAGVGDEVGDVEEAFGGGAGVVEFDDGAGDEVDVTFDGEVDVFGEVCAPLAAGGFEGGVLWDPVEEVVFGEDGELGMLFGGAADDWGCC